jgi:hypothetical protein
MINKSILKATNNFKTTSSVYIKLHDDKKQLDQYPRKYFVMADNRIYVMDLKNNNIDKTDLSDITNTDKIIEYDNTNYGFLISILSGVV